MASRSVSEGTYLRPPSPAAQSDESDGTQEARRTPLRAVNTVANIYDAVAGRVTSTAPLGASQPSSRKPRKVILAPEEVLFQRKAAPVRFAEKDIYFANERLPDGGRDVLPDSDLVKSIHRYTSAFYEALVEEAKAKGVDASFVNIDTRSMDETALLAFGILLEEAGREVLGRTGDLVFTEGIEMEVGVKLDQSLSATGHGSGRQEGSVVGSESDSNFVARRKRRKVTGND